MIEYDATVASAEFGSGTSLWGTVTGDASFDGDQTTYNAGLIQGNATFNGSSYQDTSGRVVGNATFNDGSHLGGGVVEGNATFNDSSRMDGGTIQGDMYVHTDFYNGGSPSAPNQVLLVADGWYWGGQVLGTMYDENDDIITDAIFYGASYMLSESSLTLTVTFYGASFTDGTVVGTAYFYDNSTLNESATVTGNVTAYDSAGINGQVQGLTTLLDGSYTFADAQLADVEAYNWSQVAGGNITGYLALVDNAYISGSTTVYGDLYIAGGYYNDGDPSAVGGVLTIQWATWQGNPLGSIYGADSSTIVTFTFGWYGHNAGTIPVSITTQFTQNSTNDSGGLVQGAAYFLDSSWNNQGLVSGPMTWRSNGSFSDSQGNTYPLGQMPAAENVIPGVTTGWETGTFVGISDGEGTHDTGIFIRSGGGGSYYTFGIFDGGSYYPHGILDSANAFYHVGIVDDFTGVRQEFGTLDNSQTFRVSGWMASDGTYSSHEPGGGGSSEIIIFS
jgi:hypothetical protein